ncbi:MAG TPA: metalloregulator ArsR/SmtB family transcription factor [Anaerolineaceae bacterium]|nr:metalloregulator ArsR/SmtB family transcription factor [Anaerolineaceae bacterium]
MNVKNVSPQIPQALSDDVAQKLHLIGQPARLRILLAIGSGEACVCHLEACLGFRQAYISQQLMLLRDAGMVNTRRVGKHIYYSLEDPRLIDIVRLAGIEQPESFQMTEIYVPGCVCPLCLPNQTEDDEEGDPEASGPFFG